MIKKIVPGLFALSVLMVSVGLCFGASENDKDLVLEYRRILRHQPLDNSSQVSKDVAGARDVGVVMNIRFPKNGYQIPVEDYPRLTALGKAISEDPELKDNKYVIEGHTCNLGSLRYNVELGKKRAQAVADFLISHFHFPRDQFEIVSYGPKRPVVPNTSEENRRKNRRVVIRRTVENRKLKVFVKALNKKGEIFDLKPGQVISSKNGYSLEIQPKEDVYAYVCQVSSSGEVTELFPNPRFSKRDNNFLKANELLRLPKFGEWFYVEPKAGTEQIIVAALRKQIDSPMNLCCRLSDVYENNEVKEIQVKGIWDTTSLEMPKEGVKRRDSHSGFCGISTIKKGIGGVGPLPQAKPEPETKPVLQGENDKPQIGLESEPVASENVLKDITVWTFTFRHI